jgi:long-chain fatty acid transport protein
MKIRSILACSTLILVVNQQLFAVGSGGIGNEVLSARSLGEGAVGVAGQGGDDPSVTYTNPAGLTNLKGTQVTIGATWESIYGSFQDNSGNQTSSRLNDVAVPNAAISSSFMDGKLAAGLSVESPYGLETHWGYDSTLRYNATDSKLHLIIISPALAYQINPTLSVGAGADYVNLFNADLEKRVAQAGASDANTYLMGTGTNWGYHAGVLIQPNDHHAFGITYHSKVIIQTIGSAGFTGLSGTLAAIFGGSTYSTSAWTNVYLPQNIQFGYAYKPNDKWTLEADTAWYDWYSTRDLNIRYAETNPVRLAVLNAGNPTPYNWRDAWSLAAGANYKYSNRLQLRGGAWYQPYASPESTFSPAYNDLNRYGVAIGTGYDITPHVTVDIAETVVLFQSRVINNATGLPGGTFSDFANLLTANITYKFD